MVYYVVLSGIMLFEIPGKVKLRSQNCAVGVVVLFLGHVWPEVARSVGQYQLCQILRYYHQLYFLNTQDPLWGF
jgi:hypothetical protein